jgi:ribonuclease HI
MGSIFCDGACRGNGKTTAVGGWAWAYWSTSPIHGEPSVYRSAKLEGPRATNQRAELTALFEALRWWDATYPNTAINIYTDSKYALQCTKEWGPTWKKRGWTRSNKEPILNLDLIVPMVEIWKPMYCLNHIRGHQAVRTPEAYGNDWVDRAAVAASTDTIQHVYTAFQSEQRWITIEKEKETGTGTKCTDTKQMSQTDIRNWF